MTLSTNSKKGQSLCLSCGFCCDGTLFGFAGFPDGVNQRAKFSKRGFLIRENDKGNGSESLVLPCVFHTAAGCQVYLEEKPQICGKFECRLLKDLQEERYQLPEAETIVRRTREMKEELLQSLESFVPESRQIGLHRAGKIFQDQLPPRHQDYTPMQAQIALTLFRFRIFVTKYFYLDRHSDLKEFYNNDENS